MRIAYFSDNFYPEISGISDSIITTGEALQKRGHKVVYIAPWYPKRVHTEDKQNSKATLPTKRIPSLFMPSSPTGQSRVALPFGFSILFLKTFKPDIIHTQSPYGTGLEALLASRLLHIPLVGTNHTPIEEFVEYVPLGKFIKPIARHYDAWYYNRTRFTTAPYQGLIDAMRTVGFKRDGRGQANPVPFLPQLLKDTTRAAYKEALGISGSMILCSGRIAPEKHVDVVLRAFALLYKKMPHVTLVITGRGSAEASLKKLAESLSIQKSVRFMGFVVSEKLARLYKAADVYVVMSTAETQSLSLMQAFANGVPAVCARARGLVDYTPRGAGFLVEPGDTEGLSHHIEELLTNHELRHTMGIQAQEFVERFTPEVVASEWEAIYKRVLKS